MSGLFQMGGSELDLLNTRRMQEELAKMNEQMNNLPTYQAPAPIEERSVQSSSLPPVQPAEQPKPSFMQRIGTKLKDPVYRAQLAAAFNTMRLNPDPNVSSRYEAMAKEQRAIDRGNKTAQQLRQSGRGDLADMIEATPENATAIYSAYLQQQLKPTTSFTQISGAQLNAKLAEQGLPPAYDSEKVYNYDEGSQKITQIGGGDTVFNMPDLTESQGASTNFYNRALNAEGRLAPFESQGTQIGQALLGEIPLIGNILQSPEYQVYSALKANFISAVLRKESGAAISVAEFEKEDKKYFPQVGDKPETIAEKRRARNDAIQGLKFQAGAGVGLVESQGKLPEGVTVKKKDGS